MKIKYQKITNLFLYAILAFFIVRDYMHKVPYKLDFLDGLFWPVDSPVTITWVVLLVFSIIATIPLFQKHLIGGLGLVLLVAVIAKPVFIKKVPRETAKDFLEKRATTIQQLLKKYKNSGKKRIVTPELASIDIQQLIIQGDTYVFVVDSMLDNAYGLLYDEDGTLPESVLNATTSFTPIGGKWYEFSTT